MSPLIFIMGPTCTGKTSLSLKLANAFKGEIVNCDSVQFYKRVNVGTAKPSKAELKQAPHHLYDIIPPPLVSTAGQYRQRALALIESFNPQKTPLLFVGGSGFYFQALEKGMYSVGPVNAEVLEQIENMEPSFIYRTLMEKDKEYAQLLSPQDLYRQKRALGLILTYGKTFSDLQKEHESSTEALKNPVYKIGLWLEREDLFPLVTARAKQMVQGGLFEEVQGLLDEGLVDWAPMKSIGYKEAVSYIREGWSKEKFFDELIKNTLRLAKKQRTWFKRDPNIHWYNPGLEKKENWNTVTQKVRVWLEKIQEVRD